MTTFREVVFVRTTIVETFQSTMNQCFTIVVEEILGRSVREEIFQLLERNGIEPLEISSRFDDVIEVLTRVFGISAQILVYKTVTELYKEYSLRTGFAFGESMKDQVAQLREKVANDLLKPRHYTSIDP
ncbi:MAG TPA: hypothetical protein VGS11_12560 [Candidatus Bathyarchaeia archaeon]|nr:hypothetical protein [Candidatus Bathyarchaeia archaeon]